MQYPIYQVDAFTSALFGGNPAAVMPLEAWLDDGVMQAIAAENNLPETAFFVARGADYELRWFTPAAEVDLCGHATLATAHVLIEHLAYAGEALVFHTRSGALRVQRSGGAITLDFPAYDLEAVAVDRTIAAVLGSPVPQAACRVAGGSKLVLVYASQADVAALAPDFGALKTACESNVIATAPGQDCDFVSRFFAPRIGIDEDPVTGSAHCALVPYWARQLDKSHLRARQISARGGELDCELRGARVLMSGRAVTYMQGMVGLPTAR
ncbi:PhzF family phenazine biosynthesis protein [Haliea sp. E17]|uniref:PhzF family phenazine biosynthesis protein n=1 Tax=Haliea sp. E17 TaxID=3401576 RepID=UPI003AAC0BBF